MWIVVWIGAYFGAVWLGNEISGCSQVVCTDGGGGAW